MKVQDVMINNVSACRADQNLAEVTETMWNGRCGSLPVLDSRGTVTGMITDRDICIALGTRDVRASELHVKDVSLPRVFSCLASDDIAVALKTMVSQNVRRLPVVDENGELAGILSIDDLLPVALGKPAKSELSIEEVIDAAKSILKNRARGAVREPAELIAVARASGRD